MWETNTKKRMKCRGGGMKRKVSEKEEKEDEGEEEEDEARMDGC